MSTDLGKINLESLTTSTMASTSLDSRSAVARLRSLVDEQRKSLAPWKEFITAPSNPGTIGETTKRIVHNVSPSLTVHLLMRTAEMCVR
eukprot:m.59350 g.59350  ORF g.59350 m.59350 type:complete len:89 (-) comp13218_c1_seq2:746-1012(-)